MHIVCVHSPTRALNLLDLRSDKSEIVYDLGCGDGSLLIEAAKIYGKKKMLYVTGFENRHAKSSTAAHFVNLVLRKMHATS